MGLKDSLMSMMGDFVQMNKNPNFRSKTDLVQSACAETTGQASPHRHSLSITVGTDVTDNSGRQRTFSITPKMQKHLETINKRALKKNAGTTDDSDLSLRQRVGSFGDKEDAELAARYHQRPRRRSEPVTMGLETVKEHKSSRKSGHRSKDGDEEKKSRRKSSETSASRSRSGSKKSFTNSRKNSTAHNSKIDEEEDGVEDAEADQRICLQSAPVVHRLVYHSGGSCGDNSRGSPGELSAMPIPENWGAERSYAEHDSREGISMNPLVVELKNIEQEDHATHQHSSFIKEKDANTIGDCKISCASRKSSISTYPPPVALITNITRF